MHVLGIDVGGTKTVCLLADEEGRVIASARGEGANLQGVGELGLEKVLHQLMEKTLGDERILPSAICLGIAGVDRAADEKVVRSIMSRIGYKAKILVVNDALIALQAGIGHGPGIVIVSGTGSIAYGRNSRGEASRAGGWGYVLGDEGSGYWIGRAALRAVLREADRRGPATQLTALLLNYYGVSRPQDLIHQVYHGTLRPSAISALAQCVMSAFTTGDEVAIGILRAAADQLESSALSVARRLEIVGSEFPFVL
jgi:glucosamine kinase